MARNTLSAVAQRRSRIINLLSSSPQSAQELQHALRPKTGRRTINADLAWLRTYFPAHCVRQRAEGRHGTGRVVFRWRAGPAHLCSEPLTWLSEAELIALVVARGMLDEDPADTSARGSDPSWSVVMSQLLRRCGVAQVADVVRRHAVTVSRFGTATTDPDVFAACLASTVLGEGLEFEYENLAGRQHHVHASPQRLWMVRGEWLCIAWAESLRTYRLSRMRSAQRVARQPPGRPVSIPTAEVNAVIAQAFSATGSGDPGRRRQVVLACAPEAKPFILGRRWGDKQITTDHPPDLPPGWWRLSFTTTGLADCVYWVLGLGAKVRAEQPPELVARVAEEVTAMYAALPHRPPAVR